MPNTFTPDQDEYNQQWKPIFTSGFEPYDYKLTIYNRWGEMIWECYNPYTGWSGNYGDKKDVQEGVYTWEIVFVSKAKEDKRKISGTVNVLR